MIPQVDFFLEEIEDTKKSFRNYLTFKSMKIWILDLKVCLKTRHWKNRKSVLYLLLMLRRRSKVHKYIFLYFLALGVFANHLVKRTKVMEIRQRETQNHQGAITHEVCCLAAQLKNHDHVLIFHFPNFLRKTGIIYFWTNCKLPWAAKQQTLWVIAPWWFLCHPLADLHHFHLTKRFPKTHSAI